MTNISSVTVFAGKQWKTCRVWEREQGEVLMDEPQKVTEAGIQILFPGTHEKLREERISLVLDFGLGPSPTTYQLCNLEPINHYHYYALNVCVPPNPSPPQIQMLKS